MYLYYDISPQYSCTASIPKWIVIVKEKIVFSNVNMSFFISCKCCSVCFYFIWFMDSSFHFAKDILSFYTYNTCITSPDFILWFFWLQFRMSSIVRISSTFFRSPESLGWSIAMGWRPSSSFTSSSQELLG